MKDAPFLPFLVGKKLPSIGCKSETILMQNGRQQ
jgi:hypothetical protein